MDDRDPDPGADPELDDLIRANRRRAGRRLLSVGLAIDACAGLLFGFGLHLDHQQAGARVQSIFPARAVLAGGIGLVIGTALVIPGVIALLRSRRRRAALPRAQVRG